MFKPKYRRLKKDGKPFAPSSTGYRLVRMVDGTPYMLWVGKKKPSQGPR